MINMLRGWKIGKTLVKGKCTNEWFTFVTFFSFDSTHLVLLSPNKTYSVKFSNWDLILDYQLDYENICIIIF
jgi:hypothetical protein